MIGGQPVPVVGLQVLDGLHQGDLLVLGGIRERGLAAAAGVLVKVGERVPPSLTVRGHVRVPPAVGLSRFQPGVDHLEHRHGQFVIRLVLAGEQAEQGPGAGFLAGL